MTVAAPPLRPLVLLLALLSAPPASAEPPPAAPPAAPPAQAPAALPAPPPAAARAWSISLGTGAGGYGDFVDAFPGGAASYDRSRRSGRLQLDLRADRVLTGALRVGLSAVHDRWTDTYLSGGAQVGAIDNAIYMLMADATWTWYRAPVVELYGGLALGGGGWWQEGRGVAAARTGVDAGLAFQLRYFGINLGDERFRAFAELGIGFEGLVVAGLTVRL